MKLAPTLTLCFIVASLCLIASISQAQQATMDGKYGVCAMEGEQSRVISIQLILNQDNTFAYIDNTNADDKINVTGKWTIFEGDVYLSDFPSEVRIPKIWKAEKEQSALKSRKGTAFYRLCRIGEVVSR